MHSIRRMTASEGNNQRTQDPRAPRLPKGTVTNAIQALLQQEARPMTMQQITYKIKQRIDGVSAHTVYTSTASLTEHGRVAVEELDGTKYYAHHGIAIGGTAPAPKLATAGLSSTPQAIMDALEQLEAPAILRTFVQRIAERAGVADKTIYNHIANLERAGKLVQERRDGKRYVALQRQGDRHSERLARKPPELRSAADLLTAEQAAPVLEALQSYEHPAPPPPPAAPQLHVPTLHPTHRKVRPDPFDPAIAYAPAPAPVEEAPALPDVPHFIDCAVTIAGLDISARISIDLPNSIAREATFRYLVRVVRHLERITNDVLGMGRMAEELAAAEQLAAEEERKRSDRDAQIKAVLAALEQERS